MKHARASTPRDVAVDMLYAVGARRGEVGGRHRAAVPGDEWTPTSKVDGWHAESDVLVPAPRHRAAS
jgi:hypothetical protein